MMAPAGSSLLLGRYDRIPGTLDEPEFHHGLGRNLDGPSGSRVAPHPGFPLRFHELAEAKHRKLTSLPGLGPYRLDQLVEEGQICSGATSICSSQKTNHLGCSYLQSRAAFILTNRDSTASAAVAFDKKR